MTSFVGNFIKNFDFLLLNNFLESNIDFLLDARLQKIQQPTRQELIFVMRNQGKTRKLYININPKFFHLCFMSKENEQKRFIKIPSKPPMFCMLLRKYLEGAKIAKIEQPQNGEILERILEFYFETYNELSEKIYLCLAIELMGKHSNVVLYNYDTNVIIGCMHNVGAEKSSVREIIGGLPYAYPPKANNKFSGLSEFFAQRSQQININEQIDNYFADLQELENIRLIKSKLLTLIKGRLKKITTTLGTIDQQLKSADKMGLYRQKGDLIMSNLFNNKNFSPYIEVIDYETNLPLKIELDATKSLKENANEFFKLYTKAKTAVLKTCKLIEHSQMEKDYLENVLYSIENASSIVEFLEIQEEFPEKGREEGKKKILSTRTFPPVPLTIHHSLFTIYVGKNNKQNNYIVSKLARDEDLWFHVHNCAGSHVLLKIEPGQDVTDEIIFECAKLAKEYSAAKNSSKVGVIYTKRKFLKKPPQANLGYVTYKNEKEIIVD